MRAPKDRAHTPREFVCVVLRGIITAPRWKGTETKSGPREGRESERVRARVEPAQVCEKKNDPPTPSFYSPPPPAPPRSVPASRWGRASHQASSMMSQCATVQPATGGVGASAGRAPGSPPTAPAASAAVAVPAPSPPPPPPPASPTRTRTDPLRWRAGRRA